MKKPRISLSNAEIAKKRADSLANATKGRSRKFKNKKKEESKNKCRKNK